MQLAVFNHIKKNDMVKIMTGKDNGKTGKVLKVFPKEHRILIEKLNLMKRHTRPDRVNMQGGIVEKEAPINISNVMYLCPKCNTGVRVGYKLLENKKKVRTCKKCNEVLDK